ncbi:hypothetical protein F2Q68_00044062 [Brassica cretica]|uniref:Aspartic peptidase DDI1-type domain-containing protein n=1 Tax=Brassica cretica TaxID=69181 RepID=A0A8S9LV67_BRACR|nr:hypothetical protein F2Q68_00044062 [Brassica cretica]
MVPKDMSFEDAYHKYRLGNFFRESRETDKDIELLFNKVSHKPKRTLKKEQDPGKFLIPCSIHSHHLPNAVCDIGSAVSIMAIDTAELLGLKMEPSKDSFTFVDSSRVNSAGMIKNVKVEIGECIIPVDFHAMDIKSGKTSPLLFGRAFMATVGAVCDLKRNKMCLTNVDETVFYDPMEKKKSEELISCIEMFEDPGPTADSNHEPAIPESASVDIGNAASVDFQSSESINNRPSASDDSQSSESIDMKTSASVDTL